MNLPLFAALLLNILVLIPVSYGLLGNAAWTVQSYGTNSAARGILLAIYLSILTVSTLLLVRPDARMIAALLSVQIVYKLLTPLTVGTVANPVVVANLGIALFHVGALVLSRKAIWG